MFNLNYPFDDEMIMQKKKSIRKELLDKDSPFIDKKIAILSGSTIGDVKSVLELFLLDQGIRPVFYEGSYNRFYEEAVFGNAGLEEFQPEIIYIHTSNKNIDVFPCVGDGEAVLAQKLESVYRRYETVWTELKKRYGCPVIQNNFEPLAYRLLGNADAYHKYGKNNFISHLNQKMYEYANANAGFYINDISYLASWYGLEKWSNPSHWYLYKQAMDLNAIPLLCRNISRIVKSLYGKNKKALALDLDNTLWGGVIGDDGVENIRLGEESPEGRAFTAFQRYLKEISTLGITLNACSKNEESLAVEGFSHEGSVLKRDDFISWKVSWTDKNISIAAMAKEINIGLDSIVFVDDNPVEREIVRTRLPEVSVPEIGSPEEYIKALDQEGYFEITTLSEDDMNRNQSYKAIIQREMLENSIEDYGEFLVSLQMKCYMSPFTEPVIPRITQLINKTNQFNLTTKRLTENEVRNAAEDENVITLAARLCDKFENAGIVTAMIAPVKDGEAVIELWVMSCRVFKRNLEFAIFDELIRECKRKGIKKIKASYLPTKKNLLVKGLYEELGFEKTEESETGTVWSYSIPEEYRNKNSVMEVFYDEQERDNG